MRCDHDLVDGVDHFAEWWVFTRSLFDCMLIDWRQIAHPQRCPHRWSLSPPRKAVKRMKIYHVEGYSCLMFSCVQENQEAWINGICWENMRLASSEGFKLPVTCSFEVWHRGHHKTLKWEKYQKQKVGWGWDVVSNSEFVSPFNRNLHRVREAEGRGGGGREGKWGTRRTPVVAKAGR